MDKKILFAGLVGLSLVVFLGVVWVRAKTVINVSVFLSDGMYYHEKTYAGFLEQSMKSQSGYMYKIKPFFFHGLDKININSVAQSVIESRPDIIVSIGSMGTLALAELMRKRECKILHVFTGVTNSVDLGLVNSLDCPGANITGVMTGGYKQLTMGQILRVAKPNVKKVLIPYDASDDPDRFVAANAEALSDYLLQHGIGSTILPIDGLSEAVKMIANTISGHDVLIGLEVDSFVAISSGMVKICSEKGVTCFAASVEAADVDAVFSFGPQPFFVGTAAFDLVQKIIENHQHPSVTPVVSLENTRQFIINTRRAAEQDMPDLDPQAIAQRMMADPALSSFVDRIKII